MASTASQLKEADNVAYKAKNYAEAELHYTEAIDLARATCEKITLAESLHNRGMCKAQLNRGPDALADYAEAAEANPTYPKAHISAANVYEKENRHAEAVGCLRKALKVASAAEHDKIKERLDSALAKLPSATSDADADGAVNAGANQAEQASADFSPAVSSSSQRDATVVLGLKPVTTEPPAAASLRLFLSRAGTTPVALFPPPARQQRFDVARLLAQYSAAGVVAGDEYAAIPACWWDAWASHVGGFSDVEDVAPALRLLREHQRLDFELDDPHVRAAYAAVAPLALPTGVELPQPEPLPPIDFLSLVDIGETLRAREVGGGAASSSIMPLLRRDAQEGADFVLLGLQVVRALTAWHGARGPLLVRVAVPDLGTMQDVAAPAASASCFSRRVVIDPWPELGRYSQRAVESTTPATTVNASPSLSVSSASPVAASANPMSSAPLPRATGAASGAPSVPLVIAGGNETHTVGAVPQHCCPLCDRSGELRCTRCNSVWYCSAACQKQHWPAHKGPCAAAAAAPSSSPAVLVSTVAPALNGKVGLVNLGNTCFMNASLQALSATWPLTELFLSSRWKPLLNPTNPLGTGGRLACAYADLVQRMWHAPSTVRCIEPRDVRRAIGGFQERFTGFAQHDAQELLNFLVDGLHEDLNTVTERKYVEEADMHGRPDDEVAARSMQLYRQRNRSVVSELFIGLLKSTLVCPTCRRVSKKFDPYAILSLPLPSNAKRNFCVLLQRSTFDHSALQRRKVPGYGELYDAQGLPTVHLAGCTPLEADPCRKERWEAFGLSLLKTDSVAKLRAVISEETGVPIERLVLARARLASSSLSSSTGSDYVFLTTDAQLLVALAPNPAIDAVSEILAYEVPPPAFPSLQLSLHDSATTADSVPTDAPSPEATSSAMDRRVIVRVSHLTGDDGAEDNAALEPSKLPAQTVLRESQRRGQPTLVGLPHCVSVGVLRVAIARAVWPLVHKVHLRRVLVAGEDVSDEELVLAFARAIPLVGWAARDAAPSWIPDFNMQARPSVARGESVDARNIAMTGRGGALYSVPYAVVGETIEICAAWRGRFAKVFSHQQARSLAPMTSLDKLTLDIKARMRGEKAGVSLQQCLDMFIQPEVLDEQNTFYCSGCKNHVCATKTLEVWSLPEILVVHLKRFEARNIIVKDKLSTPVACPLTGLDLTSFAQAGRASWSLESPAASLLTAAPPLSEDLPTSPLLAAAAQDAMVYDCYAVVNHYGQMFGGHYTAFVNHEVARATSSDSAAGQWYSMDDETVRPVVASQVITGAAYVMFYRRRRSRP